MVDYRRRRASICCQIIFSTGIFFLLAYLFLHPKRPKCYIKDIYIPTLNKSSNATTNNTIFFNLKLINPNTLKGIKYDPVNLTFSFGPQNAAYYIVPKFFQGNHKKTNRRDTVNVAGDALVAARNGTVPVVLRVDLVTEVRIKNVFWTTKRKKVVVGTDVLVNNAGQQVSEKAVKLVSSSAGAGDVGWYGARIMLTVVFSLLLGFYF